MVEHKAVAQLEERAEPREQSLGQFGGSFPAIQFQHAQAATSNKRSSTYSGRSSLENVLGEYARRILVLRIKKTMR